MGVHHQDVLHFFRPFGRQQKIKFRISDRNQFPLEEIVTVCFGPCTGKVTKKIQTFSVSFGVQKAGYENLAAPLAAGAFKQYNERRNGT